MTNDDEQITALFDRMCAAWTAGDARAYGECFTTDCDYISYDGNRAQGREPVVTSHDKLFRGVLYGSALVGQIESIRHLADGVATVQATGSVFTAWRNTLPKRRLTRNTIVAVRDAHGWLFTAIHNGRIRPVHPPEPDSLPARMARALVHASRRLGTGRAPGTAPGHASARSAARSDSKGRS
ncbi:SgcJ/EcaC family oxidoreductase [Saccharopolyspora shandongensis]|uniref:SgcJ/EcaC family oxidoreductase n=1 Tax=Saccharopolyspora shandongensis TaxID=418495 RepID=UPI0033CFE9C9